VGYFCPDDRRLPATLRKMQEDKKLFAEKYAEKIMLN